MSTVRWFTLFLVLTAAASASTPRTFLHGPYLALGGETTMTVVWTTSAPAQGWVEYWKDEDQTFSAGDTGASTMHQVKLDSLQPDTKYSYRVICGNDTSAPASFMTAPEPGTDFAFAVYGDTRTHRDAHVAVLRAMAKFGPRFVLNTGDLVASNTPANWDDFFTDLCDSTSVGFSTPYYATPGNHESGDMYYQDMVLPRDNLTRTEEYYSFTCGDVFVLALNSEIAYDSASAQYRWLTAELASPAARSARFRIAFWHRPPYSTSRHGSDLKVRASLCKPVEEGRVDVVFNGHDHVYERTVPINGTTYVTTGGGGAPLYEFNADSDWVAYKESATHFCLVSVRGKTLTVAMIRADGQIQDSFEVVHSSQSGDEKRGENPWN